VQEDLSRKLRNRLAMGAPRRPSGAFATLVLVPWSRGATCLTLCVEELAFAAWMRAQVFDKIVNRMKRIEAIQMTLDT
jgi:hypothetical protein